MRLQCSSVFKDKLSLKIACCLFSPSYRERQWNFSPLLTNLYVITHSPEPASALGSWKTMDFSCRQEWVQDPYPHACVAYLLEESFPGSQESGATFCLFFFFMSHHSFVTQFSGNLSTTWEFLSFFPSLSFFNIFLFFFDIRTLLFYWVIYH